MVCKGFARCQSAKVQGDGRTNSDTKAFIEGPWAEELDQLMSTILEHEKTVQEFRQKQRREDPKVIEALKKAIGH